MNAAEIRRNFRKESEHFAGVLNARVCALASTLEFNLR